MTDPVSQTNDQSQDQAKQNDKEYNFAQIRKQLEQERQARLQAEERAAEIERIAQQRMYRPAEEDDDSDEPYIDKKTLEKKLNKFSAKTIEETDQRIQNAVQRALSEERKQTWIKNNPDFIEVMSHAQKFAERDPELAETILEMPDTFERQKLVYKNIKALGLHKKEEPKESIQDVVDRNRRAPFYQPSGSGAPPYASQGDFSPVGQKNAYEKMKELQARLRI